MSLSSKQLDAENLYAIVSGKLFNMITIFCAAYTVITERERERGKKNLPQLILTKTIINLPNFK